MMKSETYSSLEKYLCVSRPLFFWRKKNLLRHRIVMTSGKKISLLRSVILESFLSFFRPVLSQRLGFGDKGEKGKKHTRTKQRRIHSLCTVCSKKNAANFQMKSFRFFLRSTFLKFCMQVPMTSNITYVKSKKPPRMATLTYKHFGNHGQRCICAHYTLVHKKA